LNKKATQDKLMNALSNMNCFFQEFIYNAKQQCSFTRLFYFTHSSSKSSFGITITNGIPTNSSMTLNFRYNPLSSSSHHSYKLSIVALGPLIQIANNIISFLSKVIYY